MDTRTAQALIRFGLGRRAGEALPPDPVAWLKRQIEEPDPALAEPWPTIEQALASIHLDREASRAMGDVVMNYQHAIFKFAMPELGGTLLRTGAPFRERLVWFWVNHFAISLRAHGEMSTLLLCFVQEAIRPHVTGRFEDMLIAVMHHPAMLLYLDNVSSTGPTSRVGLEFHGGLNENLARESLELHTVTPAAGYTQRDVTEYAKILTGWSFDPDAPDRGTQFRPKWHEPGSKILLNHTIPAGEAGFGEALTLLGNHPATFHNLAFKLCRHFVADDPPPAAVAHVADVMHRTGGDLKAAALALVDLPEAWEPLIKFRGPDDFMWAVLRGLGFSEVPPNVLIGDIGLLGEPILDPDFPNGEPDTAADWANGELLLRRADWLSSFVVWHQEADPVMLAHELLGDLLSAETLNEVQHAASRRDALTLLFASPEFQRR